MPGRWTSMQPVDVAGKRVAVITRPRKLNILALDVFFEVDRSERAPSGDASDEGDHPDAKADA